jgi:hypothetical protein
VNARLRIERKRQLDVVMKNGFSITEEQVKQLRLENNDQVSMLCAFVGNCYDVAPTVIEQMREGDFHAFTSYQEEFAKIKTLQKDFPGIPMFMTPPK